MRTSHEFQCIKTVGGKVPIITILDCANEIAASLFNSLEIRCTGSWCKSMLCWEQYEKLLLAKWCNWSFRHVPYMSVFVQEPKCSSTKFAIIYTEFPVICTKFLVISNSKLFPLDFPFSNLLSVILFPVFYTKFLVISNLKLKLFPLDFPLQ